MTVPASESGRRARWAVYFCTLAAYAFGLWGPFQFDDEGVILRDATVHSLGSALSGLGGLRPLLKLSYAACWALGGWSLPFHVFNALLHLLNVELVLRLYTVATQRTARWPFRPLLDRGALLAALLFALHPLQTEAVSYISGRSASLSTCFQLLALLLYAEGVRSGRARYWLGLAGLAFLAALSTKETSVSLPLGFALWELTIERAGPKTILRRLVPWFAMGAGAATLLVMHPRYFALLYHVLGQRPLLDSLQYQLGALAYLAGRLSLLAPLCIDPGLWLARPSALVVGATAVVVVSALVAATLWRKKQPLLLFGLGWFLLQVFVPFVFLPRIDVINERHAYPANVGLFLACGSLWAAAVTPSASRLWRVWLPSAVALALAALTARRNFDYRSEVALWESTTRAAPENPRAQNNLGVAYERAGRAEEARGAFTRALLLEPRYVTPREHLLRASRRGRA